MITQYALPAQKPVPPPSVVIESPPLGEYRAERGRLRGVETQRGVRLTLMRGHKVNLRHAHKTAIASALSEVK